jgi:NAD(P)H dehydrogenase (quinone)
VKVLVVHAHPEPTSFVSAMKDKAVSTVAAHGHKVDVSDLYAESFDPVAGRHDFVTSADVERFHYQSEQRHAALHQGFAPELMREHRRIAESDAFVFTFPLWWGGVPAILKGWFDRVLAYGFAYEDGCRYDTGFFRGRAAILGMSTGGTTRRFSEDGTYGSIQQVLWPTQHCVVDYLGLESAEPFVAYAAPRVGPVERRRYLTEWGDHVLGMLELVVPSRLREPMPETETSTTWATEP